MTWIQTYTLRAFDLLVPAPEMVDAEDIAHALSRINRFNGHTHGEPYSVAHHSMLVANLLASWGWPPAVVREGLLHDAGEAYYGDITSPVKRFVTMEIDRVVRSALMLPEHETPIVKRADLVALAIERRDLFGGKAEPRDLALPEYAPTSAPCVGLHWSTIATRLDASNLVTWGEARSRFIALLADLDAQIAGAL